MNYKFVSSFEELMSFDNLVNLEINFALVMNPETIKAVKYLKFNNCKFNHSIKIIHVEKNDLDITFINCLFLGDIDISVNKIRDLKLVWHFHNNRPNDCHINSFFHGSKINISSNTFHRFCHIEGLNHHSGQFSFIGNHFKKEPKEIFSKRKTEYTICKINNNNLFNPSFNGNTFYLPFEFVRNTTIQDETYRGHSFTNNLFHKANFSETNFGKAVNFHNSKFYSTTLFIKCRNLEKTFMFFHSCEFKGYTLFDRMKCNHLEIVHSMFEKKTSFDLLEVNSLQFHQTTFLQGAFFDDLKINEVENRNYLKKAAIRSAKEWRTTLRLIKQELLKSENKIDSNRFRNYELAIHYKEVKLTKNFHDTVILWATRWSTNFGSWVWAFWFTIFIGFFWYGILYRLEHQGSFNSENIQDFFNGAYRFFLVTDFYSPFEIEKRVYLQSSLSGLILIVGKIFIAFGIYEMIQAFRKFKA